METIVPNSKAVMIYGTGGFARKVSTNFITSGFEIAAVIDRSSGTFTLSSERTFKVQNVNNFHATEGIPVFVCVFNPDTDLLPIIDALHHAGFKDIRLPWQFVDILGPSHENYWMEPLEEAFTSTDMDFLTGILADEKSRDVARSLFAFRCTGNLSDHPAVDADDQYVPTGLINDVAGMGVVDGGAFTGDCLDFFLEKGGPPSRYWAFEPDPANFVRLQKTVSTSSVPSILFMSGLSETGGIAGLKAGGSGSAVKQSTSDAVAPGAMVPLVRLDDVLWNQRVDYVKLDVEGFEAQAIAGMRRIIAECRPALAVSIYHKPRDLIEIPRLVHELGLGYRLYLRQHRWNGFDTVLYALAERQP